MFGRRADVLRCLLLVAIAAGTGCSAYDPERMKPPADRGDGGSDRLDATVEDADAAGFDAGDRGDASVDPDATIHEGCELNPDPSNDACPEICPEACNGLDDDCDGTADESEAVDDSCAAPHAQSVCQSGQCFVTSCLGGYRDCDQMALNGCEVSAADPNHCGRCGNVCRISDATAACSEGTCVVGSCNPGFGDCDGDGMSCETRTNTLGDCGACGQVCSDVPNAVPSCATGSCGVGECKAGFGDCDGMGSNGCEQSLDSLAHCGGCGIVCTKASCSGGVCTAADCSTMPGRADCDGDEASCEIDLRSDVGNCGACGNACQFDTGLTPHASLGCTDSECVAVCDPGFGDCDGDYSNGCEQPLNTLTHCGACRSACSIANAAASCSSGSCQVQSCNADWADCNGDGVSCETPLNSPEHCGSCTTACSFPNAVEGCGGSVGSRTCVVAGCEAGWADCDLAAANGCERDVRTPAQGGLGPCLPDSGCVKSTNGGREYFVCPTARTWQTARDRCRLQARGDLAQIADSTEANFVRGRISGTSWVGHTDSAREGTWIWAHNGVPFWQSGVGTLPGQYANWAPGEPNSSGNCGALYTTGQFDDAACSNALPFVCEVIPDACTSDPSKVDPGQCGCGVPDTDDDGDGYANCNDGCPSDPNKRVAGGCGCGVADTNTDGDDQLDCNETCDSDPNKTSPGACGCGVADTDTDGDAALDCNETCDSDPLKTSPGVCGCGVSDGADSDGDGTADCNDQCPLDASTAGACFPFTQSNFDPTTVNFTPAPSPTLNCGTTTVDTSTNPVTFTNWCGGTPAYFVQSQSGGPDVIVIPLKGLTVASGSTLRLQGSRPVILAVRGNVTVNGLIDANGSGSTQGAGGNWSCGSSTGGNGSGSADSFDGGGGGGGGGFGTTGGRGGRGDGDYSWNNNYGSGGGTRGNTNLQPLFGGCPGGNGGGCSVTVGAAGGAVQISASGHLDVNGTIRANGAAGASGCSNTYGGGAGGGSGGAILLQSATRDTAGATITASGGRGGNGEGWEFGSGGSGSTSSSNSGSAGGDADSGGGGGGGGYGRIRMTNAQ